MITVVLVDDHPLVLEGLRAILAGAPGIEVVGEARDGRAAVSEVGRIEPDVVIMDLEMPELDGIEATRRIRERSPATAVLVLTMFEDDTSVFAAVDAGASGYLLKGSIGEDILTAIRSAASGQTVLGPTFSGRLAGWITGSGGADHRPFPELSDREHEILDLLASGLTNGEIADRLYLSTKTIANNVSMILAKLGVEQRGQAIVKAREAGLGRIVEDPDG